MKTFFRKSFFFSDMKVKRAACPFSNPCVLFSSFYLECVFDAYSDNNYSAYRRQDEANSQHSKHGGAQRTDLCPFQPKSAAAPALSHLPTGLLPFKMKLVIAWPTVRWDSLLLRCIPNQDTLFQLRTVVSQWPSLKWSQREEIQKL